MERLKLESRAIFAFFGRIHQFPGTNSDPREIEKEIRADSETAQEPRRANANTEGE